MTRKTAAIDDAILTTNAVTGRAAVAALRRTRDLADELPLPRAFSAIATLSELSERVERHLVSGHKALSAGDVAAVIPELDRAKALAGGMMIEARPDPVTRETSPSYLVRRR